MSSRSLNKVFLIGNLTRDVELKYTAQGTAVATFGLATNRSWIGPDGQRQEDATFHRIVAWSKLAEICQQLLFKGRKVFIEGRIQTRKWTGQDGQEREVTEIVAENMMVLDNRQQPGSSNNLVEEDIVVADETSESNSESETSTTSNAKSESNAESNTDNTNKETSKSAKKKSAKNDAPDSEEVVEIEDIPF